MFERYTESARRALFLARHEVAQIGGTSIGAEHLLLGLLREPKGVVSQILAPLPVDKIRSDIKARSHFHEKIPTSVEIPFTSEAKRVLNFAAQEADRLLHASISAEHLVLGILREETSVAAAILTTCGFRLPDVRVQIAQLYGERGTPSASSRSLASEQIDLIRSLVEQLGQTPPGTIESRDLVARIGNVLDALKLRVDP
jgi:ATP-dependent Clp protease ATP-binding subunit ClpC